PAASSATVTIGQTAPSSSAGVVTGSSFDLVQATLASGNSYVMPADGTITSWSTFANGSTTGMLTMKIYRPLGGMMYEVVSHDGPRTRTASMLNTFTGLSVPVKAGDVLGDSTPASAGAPAGRFVGVSGDTSLFLAALADGASGAFMDDAPAGNPGVRVNISATFEPNPTGSGQPTATGERAAALAKCKKKHSKRARRRDRN